MSSDPGDELDDPDRRRFMRATGAASLPALAGCTQFEADTESPAAESSPQSQPQSQPQAQSVAKRSPTLEIGPNLDLGGRLIVGSPDAVGYETIEDAWAAAEDGDIIFVHASYDAKAAGESFPITLDYTEKEVMLSGGHPSGSVIDASHTTENVIEVIGKGHEDYRNKAIVQDLKIVGGNVGLRVRSAPYSTYKDLVIYNTGGDGVLVEGYTDSAGQEKGSFGITFRNCMAWRCGGAGYRLKPSAAPHSTTFYGCHSLFNGLDSGEPGVQLRGYSSRWMNGTIQNNGGFGVDARSGASQVVKEVYFEGNGMAQTYPHGVYVSETAPGFVLKGCYFQGGYFRDAPNGRKKGFRAIAIAGSQGAEIANCTYKNYTDAFAHVRNTYDADVHIATHTGLDDTEFQNSWGNTRLRSSGTVLETDLRGTDPEGRYTGDYGIHDGSGDAPWGPAVWDGSAWQSVMDGSTVQ